MTINSHRKADFPRPFQKSGLTILRPFTLLTLLIHLVSVTMAQNYVPMSYWTFDDPDPMQDMMGNFNLDPNYYQSGYTINNAGSGGVGKCMELDNASGLIRAGLMDVDREFTIEFLFKPGYEFNTTTFFKRIDGAIEARMGYPYITFITEINKSGGGWHADEFTVNLNQIGKRSYGYFMDNRWHHIVFRYNAATGSKQIWVDGELPDGYSTTTPTGYFTNNTSVNRELLINTGSSYLKYFGEYDEYALYKYILPDNQIYRHYLDFKQGKHYTFQASSTPPPAPAPVSANIDPADYAPGHPNVNISATDQLLSFPTPRYKVGHTLLPNVPLYGVEYFGGLFQNGNTLTQALNNAKVQQADLIPNFNYSLLISSNSHEYPYYDDTTKFAGYFLKLANQNPSWHTSIFSFWPQINPEQAGFKQREAYVTCGCLNPDDYLRNSSGQYLDYYGNPGSQKTLSPAARLDSIRQDGLTQRFYLQQLVNRLQRPLDLIFENGEVIPFINNSSVLIKDPKVNNDKNSTGLDWKTYEARRAKEKVNAYRDQFMSIPQLNNTTFAYFQVDGQPTWRFKYSEMRETNSILNNQRYPTGDIYMRYPYNWRYWTSAWHGWQWVVESRHVEIPLGDKLYSPPVSPGWDIDEEKNVRPAQWLGMLKAISMTGAEFYYTAYFNLTPPFSDSRNWAWQVVLPSYAQATSSRYEDLLRNGHLMEGDVPNDYINPQWNAYSFRSGDLRKLVVARKHNSIARYAITGSIQPNSNMKGAVEDEGPATITLDGQKLTFMVSRQGSTYIYDKSVAGGPVFYQIDGWHENTHPSYWTTDFELEAELHDNNPAGIMLMTEVPNGTTPGDYTDYTTFVQFNTITSVEYNFQPRKNAPATYYVWVRARSRNGVSTGFSTEVDNTGRKNISCIKDTGWQWYRFDVNNDAVSYSGLTKGMDHVLKITAENNALQIDKIVLTADNGNVYGSSNNTCSGIIPTVQLSGSNVICSGETVTLTASAGNTYLWSTGQTTQSINVGSAGNYVVTVTSSGSTGTSDPVTIWVVPAPAANITASGPTSFCLGGSVKLSSDWANFYQWSNGATTKNINVTQSGSFQVTVTNKSGCSSTSSPVNVNVTNCTTTCDEPFNLQTVNVATTYAELSWSAPNTNETGFNVKLKNMNTGYVYITGIVPNTTTAMGVGVVSNSDYRWWVRSHCGIDQSVYAGYLTFDTYNQQRNSTGHGDDIPVLVPLELLEDGSTEIDLDKNSFLIHPNPTSDISMISFRSDTETRLDLTILDAAGKVVHSDQISSVAGLNLQEIDVSGLSPGIYLVRVLGRNITHTGRLVKN